VKVLSPIAARRRAVAERHALGEGVVAHRHEHDDRLLGGALGLSADFDVDFEVGVDDGLQRRAGLAVVVRLASRREGEQEGAREGDDPVSVHVHSLKNWRSRAARAAFARQLSGAERWNPRFGRQIGIREP
jgi:hypothetical protein